MSAYDPTLAYCYKSTKRADRAILKKARKNLPRPPFLVTAVIESLTTSVYSKKTWVVDGEADAFCAAVACSASAWYLQKNIESSFSVFTNDSDLLIWDTYVYQQVIGRVSPRNFAMRTLEWQ